MTTKQIIAGIRAIQLQCNQLIEAIEQPETNWSISVKVAEVKNKVMLYYERDNKMTVRRLVPSDFESAAKSRLYVTARQDAIFLCHKQYEISAQKLAPYFARKESAIRYAIRYMAWLYEKEPKTRARIDEMIKALESK